MKAYAAGVASGFVPRVITNLARDTGITDPYMKEATGFIDRIKTRTPGLSDELPNQYSWLTGEARTYNDLSLVNFISSKEAAIDQETAKKELI